MNKKYTLLLALALIGATALQAQEYELRVHSNGQTVYSTSTSGINKLNFNDDSAYFSHNGEAGWATAFESIDSLTFALTSQNNEANDTAVVDTSDAVRIHWNGSTVSVRNPLASAGVGVSHESGHVTVTSTIDRANVVYILSGTSSNGSLTISTERKVILQLESLTLTNTSGPALYIASDSKATLSLVGTSSLSDSENNSRKGALQGAGKLSFQGHGVLNVSGYAKHGIQSSGATSMYGGTINILTASKDGMNVDDFVMYGGTLNISNPNGDGLDGDQGHIDIHGGAITIDCSANDVKGICCDSTLTITGGTIQVTMSGNQSKGMKTKQDMIISGGEIDIQASGSVVLEASGSGYDPSYCSGIKTGGNLLVAGGTVTVECPQSNAGGHAISVDGNFSIAGGTVSLTATGACEKYTDENGTFDSYASTGLKADGDINVMGGTLTSVAGGKALSCDGSYTQAGGEIIASTSAAGFTTIGSGTSCTDGFAPACLKVDNNISFVAGTFSGSSTGRGGRGIVAGGTFVIGQENASDNLIHIYVTTSGAAVNASSGGGWGGGWGGNSSQWKGLPKGIKTQGRLTINSGHVQSYCAQTSGDPTGEAIETKDTLIINGGYIEANAYDDAINAAKHILINGGHIWAYARGNDGIDCNGNNIRINGGTIIAYGTECGIDDNADNGGTHLYIQNATMVIVGGNMGSIEGTPSVTGQKYLVVGASSGGGWGGGGSGLTAARNGFCIKDSNSDEVLTFKMPTISGSGFEEETITVTAPATKRVSGIFVTSPDIQSGTYTSYASPTISGGSQWHGLYTGTTVTTSGSGTSLTAR